MIEAFLVAGACLYGNGNGCDSGEQAFFKYNKLDKMAQEQGEIIKKKAPSLYITGIVIGAAIQKKYDACLYGPIWGHVDLSNPNNESFRLIYKFGF